MSEPNTSRPFSGGALIALAIVFLLVAAVIIAMAAAPLISAIFPILITLIPSVTRAASRARLLSQGRATGL